MSINRWMDKEDVVYIRDELLLGHKHEIMPFAVLWMDLHIIILSEVIKRQIPYDSIYICNLKYDTNELIYETETDSQT